MRLKQKVDTEAAMSRGRNDQARRQNCRAGETLERCIKVCNMQVYGCMRSSCMYNSLSLKSGAKSGDSVPM